MFVCLWSGSQVPSDVRLRSTGQRWSFYQRVRHHPRRRDTRRRMGHGHGGEYRATRNDPFQLYPGYVNTGCGHKERSLMAKSRHTFAHVRTGISVVFIFMLMYAFLSNNYIQWRWFCCQLLRLIVVNILLSCIQLRMLFRSKRLVIPVTCSLYRVFYADVCRGFLVCTGTFTALLIKVIF